MAQEEPGAEVGRGVPPRRKDADATRSALLMAAVLRFARDGYDRTSVREVAADVGVNQALVYRYFGSKDALFEEVSAHTSAIGELLAGPLDAIGPGLGDLLSREGDQGAPGLVALLRSPGSAAAMERLRQLVTDDFTLGLARRLPGEDGRLRAELVAALLVGVGLLQAVVRTPQLGGGNPERVRGLAAALVRPLVAPVDRAAGGGAERPAPGAGGAGSPGSAADAGPSR
ncbi:TetR/AcrR family transcriptional regulator [Actinoalloteichus caeruleus]|uniref:TetR/AcrR family transcriptional regulator n=1 Tax=Actinoalloteichus cyanogriseus TaxID=2893586 RepID=UPI003AAD1DA3